MFTVKDVLKLEVAPALGCTDPVAIALGAAAAAGLIDGKKVDSISVEVDPNIYKNGMAVAIPGADGLVGLENAAALGAVGGDPALGLEVLAPLDESMVKEARELVSQGKVRVDLLPDQRGILIRTTVEKGADKAYCVIQGQHDNIVELQLNGAKIGEHPLLKHQGKGPDKGPVAELEVWLKERTLHDLLELVTQLDEEDCAFLREGIKTNLRLSDYGLKNGPGLGVGKTLERLARQGLIKRDMILAARILTSSAADARMAGAKLPAMSSAGSGNHGLTAVLPIEALREFVDTDEQTFLQALALSQLVTAYVKSYTGRLAAVCGCSIAAGAGATAGAAFLMGGQEKHIAGAIKNLTEDLAGIICDGAKAGCALKLATAAGTAVQAALFSLHGINVEATDGIIGASGEQTMKNIGMLSSQGMIETDRTILKIMLDKKFS